MSPQLSIIIVNYHSEALLQDCLQSVFANTSGIDYEVVVVDNSADSGKCATLLQHFNNVQYIAMPGNEGFARANNAGIKASNGEVLLLLNSDTIVKGNAIGECCVRLSQSIQHVAAGVQLIFPDGSKQISGSNNMPGGLNYLMTIPYVGGMLRLLAKTAGVQKPGIENAKATQVDVDWINGAFLMVKRYAIEKEGMLDKDFFLYHEESEWCSRLQRSGKLCVYGDLEVVHLEGGSANAAFQSKTKAYSNLSDQKGFQLMVSMLLRMRKQFGAGWYLFHLLAHTLCLPLVFLFALLASPLTNGKSIPDATGYIGNVLKCWVLLPNMFFNKPYFYKVL
jgi:GT2 family glycosyltransferase